MELNFYDIFRFITVFQFLFFSFFLISLTKGNLLSNKLFAFFLFSKALCFLNSLTFRFKETFISFSPHIFYLGESFEFVLGPALYLYTLSLAYQDFTLKKRHILHFVPFLIHLIFMSYKFHINSAEIKIGLLQGYVLSLNEYIIDTSAIYLHFLIYSIAILYVLSSYTSKLKLFYSSIEKIKLSWLKMLVIGFIILWGTAAINFILKLNGLFISYPWSLSVLLLFLFANMIMYKGLKQPEIFTGIKGNKHNGKPLLSETTRLDYLTLLKNVMENEKPYLNPTLTLAELANKISVPPRYLSYVINNSYNHNFFDFINSHRIKESKRLLSDPQYQNKTVLEVLYNAGFNSKSVFNAAFKKHSGMTPTQFKNQETDQKS